MIKRLTLYYKKRLSVQKDTLMLIPSENYSSKDVRGAVGSILSNKYSEGYPGARYYQGNEIIDEIESITIERAIKLFSVPQGKIVHANVQPYSGTPANSAILFGLLEPKDLIMGLKLTAGGHLTHGHPSITFSGRYFRSIQFDVDKNGLIDMSAATTAIKKNKPKLIIIGTTAYPRILDWREWKALADSVGAYLVADISHIAGLVIGGQHPSPSPHVDIIITTTHKTLRGPRGAMILVTKKGLKKDPEICKKIDRAVFPGMQGGPHNHTIAGIAIALKEASHSSFKNYSKRIVRNSNALAGELKELGFDLVTDGTDNHMVIIDLRKKKVAGNIFAEALEVAGIITNRNSVPNDPNSPFYPSGLRIGTPAVTTREMRVDEMKLVAGWFNEVFEEISEYRLPVKNNERAEFMKNFKKSIKRNAKLKAIRKDVKKLCRKFPIL